MSVVGIDFGTSACVLATVQRNTITIIRNDLSERFTASLVGYTSKERHIGEAAASHIKSNFKSTCRYFKQLMGLIPGNEAELDYEQHFALAPLTFADTSEASLAGYKVKYLNEERVFTAVRCFAALLTSLKTMAQKSLGTSIENVVISVPSWYNERARQAILDAAQIAGLNCLRAMNEHAAIALDYGIYRSSTFDANKSSLVTFVSFGHGSAFVSVVEFIRGQFKVITCQSDQHLGGRDIDMIIMQHFASPFQQRFGINLLENPKARLKLEEAATRMKKVLSANSEAPINIECIVNEYELSDVLTRTTFESICEPLRQKLLALLNKTFTDAGLNPDQINTVEIVGGCCRTPWVQATISEFFKQRIPLSKTLSMDETVARGCALQAAMLDPRYRVRDFTVNDCITDPILVCYHSTSANPPNTELKTNVLFDKGSLLGSKKWLTFTRSADFDIQVKPTHKNAANHVIHVHLPEQELDNEWTKRVKAAIQLTIHGTIKFDCAQLLIDEEIVETVPAPTSPEKSADTAEANSNAAATKEPASPADAETKSAPPTSQTEEPAQAADASNASDSATVQKKRIKTRKFECKFTCDQRAGFIDAEAKRRLAELEVEMCKNDLSEQKLRESINDLETYIYDTRDSLKFGSLKDFGSQEELQHCLNSLQHAQDWIYNETSDATSKDEYDSQLQAIKTICKPLVDRQSAFEDRQLALQEFNTSLERIRQSLDQQDWTHVPQDKMSFLSSKLNEMDHWLNQISESSRNTPLYEEPSVKGASIRQEKELLENFSKTVLIPKPASAEAASPAAPEKKPQNETSTPESRTPGKNSTSQSDQPEMSQSTEQAA